MVNEKNSTDRAPDSTIEISRPYKLAWGITGAGDQITEIFEAMKDLKRNGNFKITAILSKAAVKVVKAYRLWNT